MEPTDSIRKELIFLLKGGNAHMSFDHAVDGFPLDSINTVYQSGKYTPWHLLEHVRRTQRDILEFILNSDYREKDWPKDYWPETTEIAKEKDWNITIDRFHEDSYGLVSIAEDVKKDLFARIPHGTGQNILREILVVADHNAYHIGEFAIMRQVMGTWRKIRKG